MTQFNEPNRFCGECYVWLCIGEPETTPEHSIECLHKCAKCNAWRQNGIQLLNRDNVGQCWHCTHQTDLEEIYNTSSHEPVLVPYCDYKNAIIIGNKEHCICPHFKDRGGLSLWNFLPDL